MRQRIALISIAAATALVSACSPDSTAPFPGVTNESPALGKQSPPQDSYAWMGKYHNDALAYALGRIKASKKTANGDRCRIGLAALKDFQKSFTKPGGRSVVFDDLTLIDGMCEAATGSVLVGNSVGASIESLQALNIISSSASGFMDQIVAAIDYTTSPAEYATRVNKIQSAAALTLGVGSLEAGAVFGTGSIGVSSSNYWTANESAWRPPAEAQYMRAAAAAEPAGRRFTPPSSPRFDVSSRSRAIIRADVMAAIGVLVYDWWMGEAAFSKACIKAAAASLIAGIFAT